MLAQPHFKPNLIILDLNIPRISGLALLARRELVDIPVVVFSSSVNNNERERALALGAREFVSKPTNLVIAVLCEYHTIFRQIFTDGRALPPGAVMRLQFPGRPTSRRPPANHRRPPGEAPKPPRY